MFDQCFDLLDLVMWQLFVGFDIGLFVGFGMMVYMVWFGCVGQYDLLWWCEGGVMVQVCVIYFDDDKLMNLFYCGMEMMWYFYYEIECIDDLVLVMIVEDICCVKIEDKVVIVFLFEGCEVLGVEVCFFDFYYKFGLCIVSLMYM